MTLKNIAKLLSCSPSLEREGHYYPSKGKRRNILDFYHPSFGLHLAYKQQLLQRKEGGGAARWKQIHYSRAGSQERVHQARYWTQHGAQELSSCTKHLQLQFSKHIGQLLTSMQTFPVWTPSPIISAFANCPLEELTRPVARSLRSHNHTLMVAGCRQTQQFTTGLTHRST